MRIATFLPHVGVFGGVRRFIELGNSWTRMGHEVTLYHPEGGAPAWLDYAGMTAPLAHATGRESDLALCADPHTWDAFLSHRAGVRLYYAVLEGDPGIERAARTEGVRLAANSGRLLSQLRGRSARPVVDGIGGLNPLQFRPDPSQRAGRPLRVLVNGRRSRPKKGTDLILAALRAARAGAPEFEVVLFDHVDAHNRQDPRDGAPLPPGARFVMNPSQRELVALYQSADVFIAAERKAGWCNTALEAMACGAAVVCTRSGTADFARDGVNALVTWRHPFFLGRAARRVLGDPALRAALQAAGPAATQPWTWDRLAAKLLSQLAPA